MGEKIVSSYILKNAPEQTITGNLTVTGAVSKPVTVNTYVTQGKLNSNQAIPNTSDTIIQFIDDFDPQNWWNSSTYQFTPTISGYYLISVGVWFDSINTTGQLNVQGRKNGNTFAIVQNPNNNETDQSVGFTKIVSLNGTSDYIDFTFYQRTNDGTGARNILQGTPNGSGTWFSAVLLTM